MTYLDLHVNLERILKAKQYQTSDDESGDVVFALFLEPCEPTHGSSSDSIIERVMSYVVENWQPSPVMTHVELVVPLRSGSKYPVNFALYINSVSGWMGNRVDNYRYYLGVNANRWRAIPVFGKGAARLVRKTCDESVGVQYSLLRYVTASKMFRGLSGLVPNKTRSAAHCATLTARILNNSLCGCLPHCASWYGPASLFADLSVNLRKKAVAPETTIMDPDTIAALRRVLHNSDDDLMSLAEDEWMRAIRALTLKTAASETHGDYAMQKMTQKQLATALLRWSVLQHST
jgi:hypothetical protein